MRIMNCILVEPPEPGAALALPLKSGGGSGSDEAVTPSEQGRKLDRYTAKMTDDECSKVVTYCKEWNTNARHAQLSQLALASLLRTLGVERLLALRQVADAVPALLAYSERHFQRVDRLNQGAYVLEYMLGLMALLPLADSGSAAGSATRANTGSGSGAGRDGGKRKRDTKQLVIFSAAGDDNNDDDDDSDDDDGTYMEEPVPAPAGKKPTKEKEKEKEKKKKR